MHAVGNDMSVCRLRRPINSTESPERSQLNDLLARRQVLLKSEPLEQLITMFQRMSRMCQSVSTICDRGQNLRMSKQVFHLVKNVVFIRKDAVVHVPETCGFESGRPLGNQA